MTHRMPTRSSRSHGSVARGRFGCVQVQCARRRSRIPAAAAARPRHSGCAAAASAAERTDSDSDSQGHCQAGRTRGKFMEHSRYYFGRCIQVWAVAGGLGIPRGVLYGRGTALVFVSYSTNTQP